MILSQQIRSYSPANHSFGCCRESPVSHEDTRQSFVWCISHIHFCRAQQFQVSRAFLLQQAAWLYERELSQVRAQMRKGLGSAATAISNISTPGGTASPRPISPGPMAMAMAGGTRMARTGSGGSYGTCCSACIGPG